MTTKFRAWHKTWEEMGRISFIRYKESGEIAHLSFRRNIYNGNIYGGLVKLDEIELMQSTGLFDKNGKEVFVGDIIKCTRGCPHEVYLEKEYGGSYIGGMPAIYLKGLLSGYAWTEDEEIIGNVYENPELLEVNHDTIR
ncbi:hypothetical protein B7696_03835 [Streptococcus mitis]|uniref:YopX protein domain-containing protein n=2 Tax=root TaxID=1 RepID=A0A1X1KL38_STRMT|nr:YopX family protein [Streptococcus mitis]ORP00146.1 hypothetical protein B7696_03835 [Streptococcus mitis]DAE16381.1 MAG TPA: YopX protein [Siphoviridae sp. ctePP3]